MNTYQFIIAILIMAAVTFFLRTFPFILPSRITNHPVLYKVGKDLPAAIMMMLVIYALANISWSSTSQAVSILIAIAICAVAQYFTRNMFIAIGGSTIFYMAIVQGWLT